MKKFSVIAVAMAASLALASCSTEDSPEEETTPSAEASQDSAQTDDTAAETGDAADETDDMAAETGDAAGQTEDAAGSYSEPACQEFFTEGGPLADRAETVRVMIESGDVTDQVSMSEVTLLKSRLDATAKEAPEDIAALIEQVNAPFAEAVAAVNEASEDVVDHEPGAITLPTIEVDASAKAQGELETVCAG